MRVWVDTESLCIVSMPLLHIPSSSLASSLQILIFHPHKSRFFAASTSFQFLFNFFFYFIWSYWQPPSLSQTGTLFSLSHSLRTVFPATYQNRSFFGVYIGEWRKEEKRQHTCGSQIRPSDRIGYLGHRRRRERQLIHRFCSRELPLCIYIYIYMQSSGVLLHSFYSSLRVTLFFLSLSPSFLSLSFCLFNFFLFICTSFI